MSLIIFSPPQDTVVSQESKSVSLEVFEVLLGDYSSHFAFLLALGEDLLHSLLQVPPVSFCFEPQLSRLKSLSLHKHGFSLLFERGFAFGKAIVFMLFNHFNTGLLKSLAHEYLQNGFHF